MATYNINGLTITSAEPEIVWGNQVDLENGFIYVVLELNGEKYTLQACLETRKDGKGCKKVLDKDDCGFNEGTCSDVNDKLLDASGIPNEQAFKILLSEARRLIKII